MLKRKQDPAEAKKTVEGLLGAIFTDSSLDSDGQKNKLNEVLGLRSTVLGEATVPATQAPLATADPAKAPTGEAKKLAWSQLEALDRAAEIPSLDNAAKALAGITALLSGLLTAVGFTSGDFARMFREHILLGIVLLVLASIAIILGTFAFAVNAYRSRRNLLWERAAVYAGIVCAAVAFGLAAGGLSLGATAGSTRPEISASFTTVSDSPALSVSVTSSSVPRSEHLNTTVWGYNTHRWTVLSHLVTGPAADGSDNVNVTVSNVTLYKRIQVNAFLSSKDVQAHPAPSKCSEGLSCFSLAGLTVPSPSPSPAPTTTLRP